MSLARDVAAPPKTIAAEKPVVPFERWAAVSARLLKRSRDERLDMLEENEIDPLDWASADRYWVEMLAEDLDRGDDTRASHYAKVCAEELRRRERPETPSAPEPKPEPKAAEPPAPPVAVVPAAPAPIELAPTAPPAAALPVAPPAVVKTPPRLDMTAPAFVAPVRGEALPFGDKPSLDLSEPSPPQPKTGISGETLPLQVNLKAMALPFMQGKGEAQAAAPTMTLDAYASLCAELAAQPEKRGEVLVRYRVAEDAALNALHASWQKQFAAQPQMRAEWQSKYDAFRAWLMQRR